MKNYIRKICIEFLLLLTVVPTFAQVNIHQISTINPDSTNFSDLSFLKNTLKGVKIIGLGEEVHIAGATLDAKVRLIKYLHEKLGYDVIAFESGLYDCTKANYLIQHRKKGDSTNYLFKAIFGVWHCEEVNQLATYINQTQKTKHPLILSGFDCQFAGNIAKQYFTADFFRFIKYVEDESHQKIPVDTTQLKVSLKNYMEYSNYYRKLSSEDSSTISNVIYSLFKVINKARLQSVKISYWKHLLLSIQVDYRRKFFKSNLRDSMMAKNVEWLANVKFKNKKIILWSANSHLARNSNAIQYRYYQIHQIMGDYLSKAFKKQYYFMAFTAYEGWYAKLLFFKFSVKKPKKYSIESFFYKKGYDYAFLNLRSIKKRNNPYFHNSEIFGFSRMDMNLFKVADGVFYIKRMYSEH